MRHAEFIRLTLASVLLLLVLAGCGGSDPLGRHAISGAVTLDGASVAQGSVAFQPAGGGTTSSGAMIHAGKYVLPQDQGLPPGKYRVVINSNSGGTDVAASSMPGETPPPAKELIPPEWNVDSKETIEVKSEGPFEFNFDVKSKK